MEPLGPGNSVFPAPGPPHCSADRRSADSFHQPRLGEYCPRHDSGQVPFAFPEESRIDGDGQAGLIRKSSHLYLDLIGSRACDPLFGAQSRCRGQQYRCKKRTTPNERALNQSAFAVQLPQWRRTNTREQFQNGNKSLPGSDSALPVLGRALESQPKGTTWALNVGLK